MPPPPPAFARRKTILLLALVVLVVHLVVLHYASVSATRPASTLTRPLVTRTLPATSPANANAPARNAPRPAPPARVPRPSTPVTAPAPVVANAAPEASPPSTAERPAEVASATAPAASAAASTPVAAASAPSPLPAEEAAAPAAPASAPQPSVSVPGSKRLKYTIIGEIRKLTYHASGELLWAHDGQSYEARLEVGAFLLGSRVQTSRGRISPAGLMPRRFGDKVRSEVAAHFEYDKGKVIFSANTPEAPLQPGAQDQLSIFIQLASLIGGAPGRYPEGTPIEMQAVGARESDTWRFVVGKRETLQLPGGEQETLKLTRVPNHPHDLGVELWMASALGWLPVRIRLTQDNADFIDQQWSGSDSP